MRLIDADELRKWYAETSEEGKCGYDIFTSEVLEDIDNAPTIDARPATKGNWKTWYHGGTNFSYSCDRCGAQAPFLWNSNEQKKTRYCYNCGARMLNNNDDLKVVFASLYGKCVTDGEE